MTISRQLKKIWICCSVLAVIIPFAELAIHKYRIDRAWPAASEIMVWLWPTQIFGLVLYSPSTVNDPASNWPAIVLTLSIIANIFLYTIVGTIGYFLFRTVFRFRNRAQGEAR